MLLSTLTDLQPWCLIVSLKWLGVHQSVLSSILPKLMTFVPCLRGNLLCWTCCVLDDKTEFVACLLSGDGTTGGGEMFPLWDCVSICWFGFKGRSSQDRLAALGDDNLLLFCWLGKDAKLFPTSADSPEAPNCINQQAGIYIPPVSLRGRRANAHLLVMFNVFQLVIIANIWSPLR